MESVRRSHIILIFILVLVFAFVLYPKALNAQIKLQETEVTFTELSEDYDAGYIEKTSDSVDIKRDMATSSNTKVAEVYSYEDHISIAPIGLGECWITVIGEDNTTTKVRVKVTMDYMKKWLKGNLTEIYCVYGTKKLSFWTDKGVYGTFKVGKDTYSFKANGSSKRQYIIKKLKKSYKYKEKITITAKYDSNKGSGGGTVTITEKSSVGSATYLDKASASKKTLKMTIYDLHKGDKIYITYKGKTYTKKIKKDKCLKNGKYKIKLKKKLKKNASFKIKVKNKYKQTIYTEKIKLVKGTYQWVDPNDENPGM